MSCASFCRTVLSNVRQTTEKMSKQQLPFLICIITVLLYFYLVCILKNKSSAITSLTVDKCLLRFFIYFIFIVKKKVLICVP